MAFRFSHKESIDAGIARMVGEQVDRAIAEIRDPEMDRDTAVHQVRKRCKKIRAVLRLVRSGNRKLFECENARFRDLARGLSGARDAQIALETYDHLMAHFEDKVDRKAFGSIRGALTRRRKRLEAEGCDVEGLLAAALEALEQARCDIEGWKVKGSGFSALRTGLETTYERGRKAMVKARKSGEAADYHDWRKRAKAHRYQVRALRNLWPEAMNARRAAAGKLGELLGQEHDLAVLAQLLREDRAAFGDEAALALFEQLIAERREELQREAKPLARRLYAEKPQALSKRFKNLWKASR